MPSVVGLVILTAAPRPPRRPITPLRRGWTWSPRRGTSPPLDRTSGLPFKAAITDLALPRHHRTRHPQYAGRARQLLFWREVCCSCRPPLCGGRGAHPSWGGHRSTCQSDGRVGRAGDFSLYGPSYVRGRDAPPHAGGGTYCSVYLSVQCMSG